MGYIQRIHDDSMHTGSAKRDTASGVAGLSAGGDIITPGNVLYLKRDGSDDSFIGERTSGEAIMAIHRSGANVFVLYNNTVAGGKIIQDSSMKDAASGIAGLNASAKVPDANLESPVGTHAGLTASHGAVFLPGLTTGYYTGDGTANRAIAHGLGRTINLIHIIASDGANVGAVFHIMISNATSLFYLDSTANGMYAVTQATATNFYVGNATSYPYSANANGVLYFWIAFG